MARRRKRDVHKKHRIIHRKYKSSLKTKIIASLLILIILIAAVIFIYPREPVVAKVNGEKITEKRIEALYNALPENAKMKKNIIMWRLIDTKIFVDYIESQGYGLTKEEFNRLLNEELEKEGITLSELKENLKLRGSVMDEVEGNFIIAKYVDEIIIPQITVTDEDVTNYKKLLGSGGMTDAQLKAKMAIDFRKDMIEELTSNHTENVDVWINEEYRELYRQQ